MMLHIQYIDGSNPFIMQGSKKDVMKEWAWHEKRFPAARCLFVCNGLLCRRVSGGGYAVAKHFDGAHRARFYARLGNALNYMEKYNQTRPGGKPA